MKDLSVRWVFNCRRWTPTQHDLLKALSCIQKDEIDRIFKYVYKRNVKPSLIGQLMLRRCIADCTGIPYDQVQFVRADKGKPILPEHLRAKLNQPFDFNISHDGDYCILAAEGLSKIGADISYLRQSNLNSMESYFQTMKRTFSPEEWQFIRSSNQTDLNGPLHRFHRLWALKESYFKAETIGILEDLRKIRFVCPTRDIAKDQNIIDTKVYLDGELQNEWLFEESIVDEKHFISVALFNQRADLGGAPATDKTFNFVPFNELVDTNVIVNVNSDYWDKYLSKEEGAYD